MSLPRYIVNYNDADFFIDRALKEGTIKVGLELTLDETTTAVLDTTLIELTVNELITTNIIVNEKYGELLNVSREIIELITLFHEDRYPHYEEMETSLLDVLEKESIIKKDLEDILLQIEPNGEQKIQGFYEYIPPGINDWEIELEKDTDIILTALTFSQIGWKLNDAYSVLVGDDYKIINNVATKEIAEKKRIIKKEIIRKDTPLKFILHNNSGNSRQMWIDIEYIEL